MMNRAAGRFATLPSHTTTTITTTALYPYTTRRASHSLLTNYYTSSPLFITSYHLQLSRYLRDHSYHGILNSDWDTMFSVLSGQLDIYTIFSFYVGATGKGLGGNIITKGFLHGREYTHTPVTTTTVFNLHCTISGVFLSFTSGSSLHCRG